MANFPMVIARHGGGCCGVTHIRGLAGTPQTPAEAFIHPRNDNPSWSVPDLTNDPFWWNTDLPAETYGDRFLRCIQYVETCIRAGGLIEVTTATVSNRPAWTPFLEKIGFVPHAVTGNNSNTRNEITIWVLDTNDKAHKKHYAKLKPIPVKAPTKAATTKAVFAANTAQTLIAPAPVAAPRARVRA